MQHPQTLLNEDGSASMASMLLMSHHAFRRDIVQFARALTRLRDDDSTHVQALQREWQFYRGALHGHHHMEDSNIFPSMLEAKPNLAPTLTQLSADHRKIDPLLEQGDSAFAALPKSRHEALRVVTELKALLDTHLVLEEREAVPVLRTAREFPAPPSDADAALYADGFAWSSHGVAPEVLERVYSMLGEPLRSKIPAARRDFAKRCEHVWGAQADGASLTCVPEWLGEVWARC